MRRLQIKHITTYQYAETVTLLEHRLLLRPREGHNVHIEAFDLSILPEHRLLPQLDVYDNTVIVVSFNEPCNWLSIDSRVILQHFDARPLDFVVVDYAVFYPFRYGLAEQTDLRAFLLPLYATDLPMVREWLRLVWAPGQVVETYVLLDRLNKMIASNFRYQPRELPGVQSPATTLMNRSGSCRDFATLFIDACHCLGLAARFVSGYLCSPTLGGGTGATHAWSEVYLPGAGWKGFDSTSGQLVGNEHIALAVSRNPESVPPVSGSFIGSRPLTPVMQVVVEVAEIPG